MLVGVGLTCFLSVFCGISMKGVACHGCNLVEGWGPADRANWRRGSAGQSGKRTRSDNERVGGDEESSFVAHGVLLLLFCGSDRWRDLVEVLILLQYNRTLVL